MIRVAVVDDEQNERETLKEYFERIAQEMGEPLTVTTFASGDDLVEKYDASFDILCLDIEMPGSDGISTAKQIRQTDSKVIIIFVTNLAQMAIRGYEVQAMDFILKPVNYYAFAIKVRSMISLLSSRRSRMIALNTMEGIITFPSEELRYVEVQGHKLYYHLEGRILQQKAALHDLEEKLSGLPFSRCNQSFLVNLQHVKAVRKDEVLVDGDWLKISRSRKAEFLQAVSDYMGGIL